MRDRTGMRAPSFRLTDADGTERTLEDYEGRWLLLMFHRHLG